MSKMFKCEDGTAFSIDDVVSIEVAKSCPSYWRSKVSRVLFVDEEELKKICVEESEMRSNSYRQIRDGKEAGGMMWLLAGAIYLFSGLLSQISSEALEKRVKAEHRPIKFHVREHYVMLKNDRQWCVKLKERGRKTITNADCEKLKKILG